MWRLRVPKGLLKWVSQRLICKITHYKVSWSFLDIDSPFKLAGLSTRPPMCCGQSFLNSLQKITKIHEDWPVFSTSFLPKLSSEGRAPAVCKISSLYQQLRIQRGLLRKTKTLMQNYSLKITPIFSMEKFFPNGNQVIDPRIRYANEPSFGACIFPSWTVNKPCFTKKKDIKTQGIGWWKAAKKLALK